ncbi:MAG TPA: ABC transporter permease [Bacteroidales bacterium]|nr:ABC transporter permease [Bacteroidales bacterium]
MLANYLKLTLRNLKSNKSYFLINLLGLTIGIASFIMIIFWIRTETSYDKFHKNATNTYRIDYLLYEEGVLEQHSASGAAAIGMEMKKAFPEVKDYTRFMKTEVPVKIGDRIYKEKNALFAQSSFFDVFSFPLVMGKADSNLLDLDHVVLTEESAKRYFGNENPLGKTISLAGQSEFLVTGVVKSPPSNSHLKFDILFSYENLIKNSRNWDNAWVFERVYSYVLLSPATDPRALEKKLPQLVESFIGRFMKEAFFLLEFRLVKLTDIHLHSSVSNELEPNGNYRNVIALGIVALLVLCIAFINYINLATSRSLERAHEVGIRKISGAVKKDLLFQFLTESGFLNIAALVISLFAVVIFLPFLTELMDSPLMMDYLFSGILVSVLFITGTIVTGLLPAIYISRFAPGHVLKGKNPMQSSWISRLKNFLVILQFTISITLIICTLIIFKQVKFMSNHNPGFDINKLLVLEGPVITDADSYESYLKGMQSFKDEISSLSMVGGITGSSNVPGTELKNSRVLGIPVEGRNTEKKIVLYLIDNNFFQTYGIKILAGENFGMKPEQTQLIVNESALPYYGFADPENTVGKFLRGGKQMISIKAIAADFNQLSMKDLPRPVAFFNQPVNQYYTIKADMSLSDQLIPAVHKIWDAHYPGNPFDYFFLREFYDRQYSSDKRFGILFLIGALISIIIACMGLAGLSAYSISKRVKEIGIRKSNGAKIFQIMYLLNRDFLKWVIIAFVFAAPFALFLMNRWLDNYAFKTDINWWIFVIAGSAALMIAFITVSWQSWKASSGNPVEALRYE